jgi:hypothetical protein
MRLSLSCTAQRRIAFSLSAVGSFAPGACSWFATDAAASRAIDRFCEGWHINALLHQDELRTLARDAGFEHQSTVDLTPALELGRVRDRAIGVLASACDLFSISTSSLDYLLGGAALQQCLARGWVGYDFSVFRRNES